jgi:bifunctional DNA-binding transcriptional regulator/antitoxin component of YhaV-PrlF toxin-antitoxin module
VPNDNPKRGLPPPTTVKNRRLKVSPGGIITLPIAARKALRMAKGEGARVTVSVDDGVVTVASAGKAGGFRVSPGGQLELRAEARAALDAGVKRHYWIELQDAAGQVRLHPYR